MDRVKIGGVIQYTDLALVGMIAVLDRPGIAAADFETLGKRRINVMFIVQSIDLDNNPHIVFCVASNDLSHALGLFGLLRGKLRGQELAQNAGPVIVSIFGLDPKQRPHIAAVTPAALAKTKMNILFLSTFACSISCVTD